MSRRELDRHDLTALLLRNRAIEGTVKRQTTYYEMKRGGNGQLVRKVGRKSVSYGLAVIDEVENWGREELSLVRGCVDADTQAVVYVGDLSQRTRLGAIATWAEAGESFGDGRQVTLHKVYRNTRQVVEYARSLGFAVEVPASLPEGPQVVCRERVADDVAYCRSVAKAAEGRLVGVLGKGEARLAKLREAFGDTDHVKVMTVEQAQGVEFDTVVLLGLNDFLAAPQGYADASLAEERARVNRDLLYVALTRAMRELHVVC
jgi:DNA helicase IV